MPMQFKRMLNAHEKRNGCRHFFRDGLDFYWNGNGCSIVDKSGKEIVSSIDTEFHTEEDVYEFYTVFAS